MFNKPKNWKDIIVNVKQAMDAVGLDIGAVDIRTKKDGDFIILETNSAPGLAEIGIAMYLNILRDLGRQY
jgi:D-alanine-D-alanine ligase-like ATP-grasp enzyme